MNGRYSFIQSTLQLIIYLAQDSVHLLLPQHNNPKQMAPIFESRSHLHSCGFPGYYRIAGIISLTRSLAITKRVGAAYITDETTTAIGVFNVAV